MTEVAAPVTLTDGTFQSEVVDSSLPVLVDFWAPWCVPCNMVAPIVEELAEEYDGRLKVGKVNVDSERKIAGEFGIRSIPTILIFKEGKVVDQVVGAGALPKKQLTEKIEAAL